MKKLAIVCMAFSMVACGGDAKKDETTADSCNATNDLLLTKCSEQILLECQCDDALSGGLCNADAHWNQKEDCATTDKTCQDNQSGNARCVEQVPAAGEFEGCTGSGQGNCEDGLVCAQFGLGPEDRLCVDQCDPSASDCDGTEYCEPGVVDTSMWAEVAFCYPLGDLNDLCFFNDDGCNGDLECFSVDNLTTLCKNTCSGADVGTAAAACGGKDCLAGPYVEVQGGDSPVACTNVGSSEAPCTDNFVCSDIYYAENDTRTECARPVGICGDESTLSTGFADQTALSTFVNSDGGTCEFLGDDHYCGDFPTNDGTGVVECTDSGFAASYDPAVECDGYDDYASCFGYGECGTYDGVTYECIISAKICIPFCTSADGTEEYSCGTGWNCALPTYSVGRPAMQVDESGNFVRCDSPNSPADCDTINGFACDTDTFSDADVCAKERKICVPN